MLTQVHWPFADFAAYPKQSEVLLMTLRFQSINAATAATTAATLATHGQLLLPMGRLSLAPLPLVQQQPQQQQQQQQQAVISS